MKKFKKLAILAAAVLMVGALSSCGSVPANSVHSVDDLPGKTIGVQLGTTGDIFAEDYIEQGSTIEQFSKGADAVQSLKQGKIDCVIIDSEPAKAFVERNTGLRILEEEFAVEDYAICIAKENTVLKDEINAAIAQLKENGTMTAIVNNYIGDDTKGKTPYTSPEGTTYPNGTLIMATNAAFEPYEFYENNAITGIDVDMAKAVCDILGMELKIEDMEFDSIISAVQSGKADIGVAGMTVTEDRLLSIDFTDSYATGTQVIIVRDK